MRQLSRDFLRGSRGEMTTQDCCTSREVLRRGGLVAARGPVRISPSTINYRRDVCHTQTTGTWTSGPDIRQFHDGMRACIRLDGNRTFQRFEVRQGLRKGYVLAPLLLNIFLTTILKHRGEVVQGRPCRGSGSGQH